MGRHGTIAGRKAAQDSKKARLFTKYSKKLTVAAKDGGDPEYNSRLRMVIEKAKAIGMPNDNIERAIKKGTGELEGVSYEELVFEGYGPGGVAFMVSCLTDNNNRTAPSMRSIFDKYGGKLGTPGCVSYMFSRKGVIIIEKTDSINEDDLMETVLLAGAEDMISEEDGFIIYTEPDLHAEVHDAITSAGYETVESEIEFVPSVESEPDPETIPELKKLLSALEDDDDVEAVQTNSAISLYD